jgi:hypothetical protein
LRVKEVGGSKLKISKTADVKRGETNKRNQDLVIKKRVVGQLEQEVERISQEITRIEREIADKKREIDNLKKKKDLVR